MGTALLWFRRDLRLADNPALHALLDAGQRPIPVYIHDEPDPDWPLGGASAWWLHHSLVALQQALQQRGSDLLVLRGDTRQQLLKTIKTTGAEAVYWNRGYEPAAVKRDQSINQALEQQGIEAHRFNAALLREPRELLKQDGTPYRVFTPFWKTLYKTGPNQEPVQPPQRLPALPAGKWPAGTDIVTLRLLPAVHWDKAFYDCWKPGEAGARNTLDAFLGARLTDYPTAREEPGRAGTSRLSPHLHFGEISPQRLWHTLLQWAATQEAAGAFAAAECWLRQLAWREFSYHLLHHFPESALRPLDPRFEQYPWRRDYADLLRRWQQGQTGIPMVDAGLRELWTTGYMHNRVRMLVASFLTKNLRIPWQEGARWFMDTLVDADLANNTMGWQWTAGSGADAAPYFRIFNPVLQGEKFDTDGGYVRHWIPELAQLADRDIHQPWSADPSRLAEAGVRLGNEYPAPVVDLAESRKMALAAWEHIKHLRA